MSWMVKGVTPIHAVPSQVSIWRRSGIRGRSRSAGIGQCRNSSLSQVWYIRGVPGGRERMERRSTVELRVAMRSPPRPQGNAGCGPGGPAPWGAADEPASPVSAPPAGQRGPGGLQQGELLGPAGTEVRLVAAFQVFLAEIGEEWGGAGLLALAAQSPPPAMEEEEAVAGAGDADEEEPPLLGEIGVAGRDRTGPDEG